MAAPTERLAAARTFLFVPGDRPERFDKAVASGADVVVLDLEDGVALAAKESARSAVATWLRSGGEGLVRVNAEPEMLRADVSALCNLPGLMGVMVPKAEAVQTLVGVADDLGDIPIVPLVESGRGVAESRRLAQVAGVARLAFGTLDLAVDLGIATDSSAMQVLGVEVVLASSLAGLSSPVAGVTPTVGDGSAAAADARASRRDGFGAKLLIHPLQVPAVASALRPREDEIAWARRIVAAVHDGSVGLVDGAMADRPVLERARKILSDDLEEHHGAV